MINRENAGIRKACIMGVFAATLCLLVLIFDISVAAKEEIMEFDNLQALRGILELHPMLSFQVRRRTSKKKIW